jgi:hypothetical protein
MALQVNADAVRALVPNGVYSLQVLEQREKQRVVITLTLVSQGGGHTVQIETTEAQILAFFQHLLSTVAQATQQKKRLRTARKQVTSAPEARQQPLITVATSNAEPTTDSQRQTRRTRLRSNN